MNAGWIICRFVIYLLSCRDHIICQKKNMEIRRRLQMKDHPLLKTMQGSKTLSILSFVSLNMFGDIVLKLHAYT